MSRQREQGAGTLLMVMLLAAMGLLLLTAMHRQLEMALQVTHDERQYLVALNRAESALNWGIAQSWPLDETNQQACQQIAAESLRVCLRGIAGEDRWLMRAEGQGAAGSSPLVLYQRVLPADPDHANSHFLPSEGGWLDFCPERREEACATP